MSIVKSEGKYVLYLKTFFTLASKTNEVWNETALFVRLSNTNIITN